MCDLFEVLIVLIYLTKHLDGLSRPLWCLTSCYSMWELTGTILW